MIDKLKELLKATKAEPTKRWQDEMFLAGRTDMLEEIIDMMEEEAEMMEANSYENSHDV